MKPSDLDEWPSSRENRERFLRIAQEFVPFLVTEQDGRLLILATDDPTQTKLFTRRKRKEQAILPRALDCLARRGVRVARTTFVDVGANVGTTTFAALHAGFSRVIACEPVPGTFRLLRANLVLNGVEEAVVPLEVALSNASGYATIDTLGGSRKARLLRAEELPRGEGQEVRLVRLDDLVSEGVLDPEGVGFLFIDAEGHECQVLEGGASLLRAGTPLAMEINPKLLDLGGRVDELAHWLGSHYTHMLDLRAKPSLEFVPVDRLGALIEELEGNATDILACRLPARA